ncbi:type II toxin-antitoxin system HicB family antitoxin [uncultured Cardiobacterium sp.]|uniref:type II toxin-antitoxin system HicB family antitoxin n=1 Tax=uncultured Cardiobacterium sp. TaxID=417619 RepID=UPI0034393D35
MDTSRLTTRAKRFNATLPENLLAAIDDYVKTHGGSRSRFLADAARKTAHPLG